MIKTMKLYDALLLDPVFLLSEDGKQQIKLSCQYEKVVIKAIKAAGIQGKIKSPACFDSNLVDADFKLNGAVYPLEIKYDTNSFLYAGGIRYDMDKGTFEPSNKGKSEVEQEKLEMFYFVIKHFPELEKLKTKFNKILNYIERKMPEESTRRKRISNGFPVQVTDKIWSTIINSDLGTISAYPKVLDISLFSKFFTNNKAIDYIQLGKRGLFYLENNPANLPIPKLQGSVQLELKWKTGGLKKDRKIPTRTASIEIIARFKDINSSPFSMDDAESIIQMLNNMKK